MLNETLIFRIKNDNVDFYNAEKNILPCWKCLVRETCFTEKKATKRAKYLRYTLRFEKLCIDSYLAINYLIYGNSDLVIPIDEIKKLSTQKLYEKAYNFMPSEYGRKRMSGLVMMIYVVHRDANYISDENETPYQLLGHLFFTQNRIDIAIELFSKSIELTTKDTLVFEDRGFCYLIKHDYDRALDDFNKAFKNNGGYHDELNEIIHDVKERKSGLRGNPMYDVCYENN